MLAGLTQLTSNQTALCAAGLSWQHPLRLALIAVAIVVVVLEVVRRRTEESGIKAWAVVALRAGGCIAIAVSLGEPIWRDEITSGRTILLRERGPLIELDESSPPDDVDETLFTDGDPARALAVAAGSVADEEPLQLVLESRGRDADGSLAAASRDESQASAVLEVGRVRDAAVRRLLMRHHSTPRGTIAVSAELSSSGELRGALRWFVDERQTLDQAVTLRRGLQTFAWETPAAGRDRVSIRVEFHSADDGVETNNTVRGRWTASPPLSVLVAGGGGSTPAQFLDQHGYRCRPGEFPGTLSEMLGYDLILALDGADQWTEEQRQFAEQYVRRGGGLFIAGGDELFAANSLENSGWEAWLPVSAATEEAEQRRQRVAMVLLVDRSESMLEDDRLGLAKQAAQKTVELIHADDRVGVLAFGDESLWVSPIGAAGDKSAVLQRIDTLVAAGVTNMYPALEKAYLALEQTVADRKHIIVLTDGISSPGDFDEIARACADAKITVGTVSISSGAEQIVLQQIAQIAGGRHHHCEDPQDLPTVLEKEARSAVSATPQTSWESFELRGLPGVDLSRAPDLRKLTVTQPKPDAELVLLAGAGDPLLAWRRHGAGAVAVFTAPGEALFGQQWRAWPAYSAMWTSLAAVLSRPSDSTPLPITIEWRGDRLEVQVDSWGADQPWESVSAQIGSKPYDMVETAPHWWATVVTTDAAGPLTVAVTVLTPDGRSRTAELEAHRGYDRHLLEPGPDIAMLQWVAGQADTQVKSAAAEIQPHTAPVPRAWPMWRWLAMCGIALFLLEIGVRRLA
ncbi:MAG: VWA domain-containing protein [Pirellulaceae bacterium]|jgi:hypothetical protein|nr:VWA domain-containing protein [Pirellulaceae bacterium]